MEQNSNKDFIKQFYGKIAKNEQSSCGCNSCGCWTNMSNEDIAQSIWYWENEIQNLWDANLWLWCGNPTWMWNIQKWDTVLDLGSWAWFDCFLAVKQTWKSGKVIWVDMTPEMIAKAKENAKKLNYNNVEFLLWDIEELPIEDNSIDVVISNCVINLATNKTKVFEEIFRVLKKWWKSYISDIVLLKDLSKEEKENKELIAGCVWWAILKDEYLEIIKKIWFEVNILWEDKDISERQYNWVALESLKLELIKSIK